MYRGCWACRCGRCFRIEWVRISGLSLSAGDGEVGKAGIGRDLIWDSESGGLADGVDCVDGLWCFFVFKEIAVAAFGNEGSLEGRGSGLEGNGGISGPVLRNWKECDSVER